MSVEGSDIGIIRYALEKKKSVTALVAPTYKEYISEKDWTILETMLRKVGFSSVLPIEQMCSEMIEKEFQKWNCLDDHRNKVLISSCCPQIPALIRREYPEILQYVSDTESPLTLTAAKVREEEPDTILVFIGPCRAKKKEWDKSHQCFSVDYILTFEELWELLGKKIQKINDLGDKMLGSVDGIAYAMANNTNVQNKGKMEYYVCAGIEECRKVFAEIKEGKIQNGYVEASFCENGCMGMFLHYRQLRKWKVCG